MVGAEPVSIEPPSAVLFEPVSAVLALLLALGLEVLELVGLALLVPCAAHAEPALSEIFAQNALLN